jgi:hypothetical protein
LSIMSVAVDEEGWSNVGSIQDVQDSDHRGKGSWLGQLDGDIPDAVLLLLLDDEVQKTAREHRQAIAA